MCVVEQHESLFKYNHKSKTAIVKKKKKTLEIPKEINSSKKLIILGFNTE